MRRVAITVGGLVLAATVVSLPALLAPPGTSCAGPVGITVNSGR